MTRDLREAVARFNSAAEPNITYQGLAWREFDAFLSACLALEKVAERVIVPTSIERVLVQLRNARRRLRTVPMPPSTPSLGLVAFVAEGNQGASVELDEALQRCRATAQTLLDSNVHPGLVALEKRVNRMRSAHADAVLYAITSRDCVSDLQLVSDERDLGIDVIDLTGAKRVDTGDVCFVFGAPESVLGSSLYWMDRDEADQKVAWLFNAPIAREVAVLSWPGNRAFRVDRYGIFPGANLKLSQSDGPDTFSLESISELVIRHVDRLPNFSSNSDHESELILARAIQLAGGYWVLYSTGPEGPRPDRIRESDYDLVVDSVSSIGQLAPGDRLVVRGGDASRNFLNSEAHKWLVEKHGKSEPNECERVRSQFRDGMQALEQDHDGMRKLRELGLDDNTIRYRFRLSHDLTHIAPESKDDFMKLSKACGLAMTDDDWDHIRHLRSAMKRAGREARRLMEEHISADTSWMTVVDVPDAATVNLNELGALVISRILQIAPDTVQAPISRLGTIVRNPS